MSRKYVTSEEAVDAVSNDLAWRRKELNLFNRQLSNSSGFLKQTLVRAGISLIYSHWEGFVKKSCEIYLEHVSHQYVQLKDLKYSFIAIAVNPQLESGGAKSISKKNEAIEYIIDNFEKYNALPYRKVINTKSNLTYDVFVNICLLLSIDTNRFSKKESLINDLVSDRNCVAHGECHSIKETQYDSYFGDINQLMDELNTELSNSIVMKCYLRNNAIH